MRAIFNARLKQSALSDGSSYDDAFFATYRALTTLAIPSTEVDVQHFVISNVRYLVVALRNQMWPIVQTSCDLTAATMYAKNSQMGEV